MLIEKKELYRLIIKSINRTAEQQGKSKEMTANDLGIASSTWYALKKHSEGEHTENLFSQKRLNQVCQSLGYLIKKELYEVEISINTPKKTER